MTKLLIDTDKATRTKDDKARILARVYLYLLSLPYTTRSTEETENDDIEKSQTIEVENNLL